MRVAVSKHGASRRPSAVEARSSTIKSFVSRYLSQPGEDAVYCHNCWYEWSEKYYKDEVALDEGVV